MKALRSALGNNHGYSLMELMLAVAVLGLAMAGVLTIHRTGNTIALTGENKAEAQQGARGALKMEEEIRLAGYGYPPAIPPPPCTPLTGTFVSASSTAVTFWADLTNSSTTLSVAVNAGNTTINFNLPPGAGFAAGNTVYLINQGQSECLTVSSATATSITVPSPGAVNAYPVGSQIARPRQITYSYAAGTVSRNPGDGTGAQPAVTGVTAFQLTYFDPTDIQIPSGSLPANAATLLTIRRIVVSMTVQSASAANRGTFTLNTSARPRNLP